LLLLAFALFHHRLHQIYSKVLVFTTEYFSSQFALVHFSIYSGLVCTCPFFNLLWSGLHLSVFQSTLV
jgi:hypothetical protein